MPYGSIDLTTNEWSRTVGSRCHVLQLKWRQSLRNVSTSILVFFVEFEVDVVVPSSEAVDDGVASRNADDDEGVAGGMPLLMEFLLSNFVVDGFDVSVADEECEDVDMFDVEPRLLLDAVLADAVGVADEAFCV